MFVVWGREPQKEKEMHVIIYTRPLYGDLPVRQTPGKWPRVVAGEVQADGGSTWRLIYDDGTHVVALGLAGRLAADPALTTEWLQMHYQTSRAFTFAHCTTHTSPGDWIPARVKDLVRSGKKIEAIVALRDDSSPQLGLREAKAAVDAWMAHAGLGYDGKPHTSTHT